MNEQADLILPQHYFAVSTARSLREAKLIAMPRSAGLQATYTRRKCETADHQSSSTSKSCQMPRCLRGYERYLLKKLDIKSMIEKNETVFTLLFTVGLFQMGSTFSYKLRGTPVKWRDEKDWPGYRYLKKYELFYHFVSLHPAFILRRLSQHVNKIFNTVRKGRKINRRIGIFFWGVLKFLSSVSFREPFWYPTYSDTFFLSEIQNGLDGTRNLLFH